MRNLIPSSHDLFDNATGNVGQSKIATGTAAGEPLVIETEQVQDCGVQVVYVGRALHGLESKIVRSTVDRSAFDFAAGQPNREPVMVKAKILSPFRASIMDVSYSQGVALGCHVEALSGRR